MLKENVGYSRQMDFEAPLLEVADDLDVVNFRGGVRLTRTAQGVYVHGRFTGQQTAECVRCLEPINQRLTTEIKQLYEYPPTSKAEFVVTDTGHLDLAPVLREDLLLAMPMRPLCKPDCKGLCPNCGQDWNKGVCDCDRDDINPQMVVLKKLLDK